MPVEPVTQKIDEYTFTISPLTGTRAFGVFNRLVRMVGRGGVGSIGNAISAAGDGDMASRGMLLIGLLSGVEPDELDKLAKDLLQPAVFTNGEKSGNVRDKFDTIFQARIDLLFRVLWLALSVNFGSFQVVLDTLAASSKAKKEAAAKLEAASKISPSDSETSGLSGDSSSST